MDFGISRFLVATPLLAALDPDVREAVLPAFRPRPFGDGEPLLPRGVEPPGLLVLLDGAAEVWIHHGGRRALVGRLGPGDLVGESALFARGLPRVIDLVGLGTGMAALLPTAAWRRLVDENHPAAVAIEAATLRVLCARLQHRMEQALPAVVAASPPDIVARARALELEP